MASSRVGATVARAGPSIKHVFDSCLTPNTCSANILAMARTGVRRAPGGPIWAVVLAAALGWTTLRAVARPAPIPAAWSDAPHTYVVGPGDTLWRIAARLAGPEGDPRVMVDRLIALNHVREGLIQPGQRLALP